MSSQIQWNDWPEMFAKALIAQYADARDSYGMQEIYDFLHECFPWAADKMLADYKKYGGVQTFPKLLHDRASAHDTKRTRREKYGELCGLMKRDHFRPILDFTRPLIDKPRLIYVDEALEIINKEMKIKGGNGPGVYVDVHISDFNKVRIGESKNVSKRRDSDQFFRHTILLCLSKADAYVIQNRLFDKICALPNVRLLRSVATWPPGYFAVEEMRRLITLTASELDRPFRMIGLLDKVDPDQVRLELMMDDLKVAVS